METIYRDIVTTIAYYHAQGYPLTTFEVWQLFVCRVSKQSVSFRMVAEGLRQLANEKKIINHRGMWMVTDDQRIDQQRLSKQKIAVRKLRRSSRWARWVVWVPFIRALFVTGTLGMKHTTTRSDWDVIVVLKQKRIWIGRFFISAVLHILGKRRHGTKITDRFCLNHFITEDGLLLDERNEFSAKEVIFSTALIGTEVHRIFWEQNLSWMRLFTPQAVVPLSRTPFVADDARINYWLRQVLEQILEKTGIASWGNSLLRRVMIRKIQQNPNTHVPGADIRYSERALVFLPVPRRAAIMERTQKYLTKNV